MSQPILRPQDVVVLVKLLSYQGRRPPMSEIGHDLSISPSQIHAALKRLALSKLVSSAADSNRPLLEAVEEFLVHGVKYAFPARRGEVTRGVPTSCAAPPLSSEIEPGTELPPVWPFAEGQHRGVTLEPLHKSVPAVALRDPDFYEIMALIDAIREGRARERKLAQDKLIDLLRRQVHEGPESSSTRSRR